MSRWCRDLAGVVLVMGGLMPAVVEARALTPAGAVPPCAVVSVDRIGAPALERVQATDGLTLWVEADEELLVCGAATAVAWVVRQTGLLRLEQDIDPRRLRIAAGFDRSTLEAAGARVVLVGGHHALIDLPRQPLWGALDLPAGWRQSLGSLEDGAIVLARQASNLPRRRTGAAELSGLAAEVDPQRWYGDVVELARFNRYTFSPDLANARDYVTARLAELPQVEVTTASFQVNGTTTWNVIGTLVGTTRPDARIIVGGHFDATSERPASAAPGAEDNASGCAGVLEMARLLSAHPPAATVAFICFSGEEQGLFGSYDHAGDLVRSGEAHQVEAMLNLDMIGFTADDDLDCLLDGGGLHTPLVDALLAAADGTRLRMVVSGRPLGSDHLPYLANDIPAVLVIENDFAVYPDYHRSTDLPENLSLEMGGEVLRMVAAALEELAGVQGGFGIEEGDGRRDLIP